MTNTAQLHGTAATVRRSLHPRAEKLQQDDIGAGAVARRYWSDFEEISHVQGQRRSSTKIVEGERLCLESNPIPARNFQRTQIYLCASGPKDPTEAETELCLVSPEEVRVISGQLRGKGLWVQ